MSARPRTSRVAIFTLTGAAALSFAALSSPAPARAQGDVVVGSVTSVSGTTLEVTQPSGNAGTTEVDLADSTRISEAIPAERGEVTVGSCITAGPAADSAPASSGAITAKWVLIGTTVDGKCPHRQGSGSTPPALATQFHGVRGVVDSVTGDTVTITRTDASEATVTVTDTTSYRRRVASAPGAITPGECVAARGTLDGNGVLQATRVTFWTPTNGPCPQPAD